MNQKRLSGRVLIVDDEEMVRAITQALLEHDGCEVVTAAEGAQARIHLTAETPFDAVLVDICLPDLEGIELVREVRALDRKVPVVLWSGLDNSGFYLDEHVFENIRYLKKPFGHKELFATVQAALHSNATQ